MEQRLSQISLWVGLEEPTTSSQVIRQVPLPSGTNERLSPPKLPKPCFCASLIDSSSSRLVSDEEEKTNSNEECILLGEREKHTE